LETVGEGRGAGFPQLKLGLMRGGGGVRCDVSPFRMASGLGCSLTGLHLAGLASTYAKVSVDRSAREVSGLPVTIRTYGRFYLGEGIWYGLECFIV
jgi:hypothetical protein